MSEVWERKPLASYLEQTFAGEWGVDPDPMNCVVYRSTDIDDVGTVRGHGAERRVPASKLLQKQLKEGDILLEASGGSPDKPVGRTAIVEGSQASVPATCSNFFRVLRPSRTKADPRFLNHKLVWRYRQPEMLVFQQQTTGIINLNFKEFLAASVEMPESLITQSKIAEVLDTLDAAIRGTEAVVAKLRAMKQGLLHDLLTRGIDANGDLRPPQPEAPHLYHQTPLGWLPNEWDYTNLGDVIASIDSGWSPACIETPPAAGEWGVLKVSAVTRGFYDDQQAKTLPTALKPRPALEVQDGDVILTRANGVAELVGKTVQVRNTQSKLMLSDKLLRLVPDKRKMTNDFLALLMTSDCIVRQIEKSMSGSSGQKNISQSQIRSFECFSPTVDEQQMIMSRVNAFEVRISAEEKELHKLRLQKSGLMDDLLAGRVPVTPLL